MSISNFWKKFVKSQVIFLIFLPYQFMQPNLNLTIIELFGCYVYFPISVYVLL